MERRTMSSVLWDNNERPYWGVRAKLARLRQNPTYVARRSPLLYRPSACPVAISATGPFYVRSRRSRAAQYSLYSRHV
jgi:hypothetical protein